MASADQRTEKVGMTNFMVPSLHFQLWLVAADQAPRRHLIALRLLTPNAEAYKQRERRAPVMSVDL